MARDSRARGQLKANAFEDGGSLEYYLVGGYVRPSENVIFNSEEKTTFR